MKDTLTLAVCCLVFGFTAGIIVTTKPKPEAVTATPAPATPGCAHDWNPFEDDISYSGFWAARPYQIRFCKTCNIRQRVYCIEP
jgi:hypothetical protein